MQNNKRNHPQGLYNIDVAVIDVAMNIPENVIRFFERLKKRIPPKELGKFALIESTVFIPWAGPFIKDVLKEFGDNDRKKIIDYLEYLEEEHLREISTKVGVTLEYTEIIQKALLFHEEKLDLGLEKLDEIKELLQGLIGQLQSSLPLSGENLSHYAYFCHSFTIPKHWVGREPEITRLSRILLTGVDPDTGNENCNVVSLTALGGEGKSRLVMKLVDTLTIEKVLLEKQSFDGIFLFSFYRNYKEKIEETGKFSPFDSIGLFFQEALNYLCAGKYDFDRNSTIHRQKVDLASEAESKKVLFILDGVELIQRADIDKPDQGYFLDTILKDFLENACNCKSSKVLLTSRLRFPELAQGQGFFNVPLGPLKRSEAIEMLRKRGVKGSEKEIGEVCDRLVYYDAPVFAVRGYHAHTVEVLGSFLVDHYEGNPQKASLIKEVPKEYPPQEKVETILRTYSEHLNENQRYFLRHLSIWPSRVDESGLEVLARPKEEGGAGKPDDESFRMDVAKLEDARLIEVEREEHEVFYSCHPHIREFFYKQAKDTGIKNSILKKWRGYAEKRVDVVPPFPHTVGELMPYLDLVYIYHQLEIFGKVFDIFFLEKRPERICDVLYNWGYFKLVNQFLSPLTDAIDVGVFEPKPIEEWELLHWMGRLSRKVEPPKAKEFYRGAIEQAPEDRRKAESLLYRSYVLFDEGDFYGSIQDINEAEALGGIYKGRILGPRGRSWGQVGEIDSAFEELGKGIRMSLRLSKKDWKEIRHACTTIRQRGDLYLKLGEDEKKYRKRAYRDIIKSLQIAEDEHISDRIGNAKRALGDYFRVIRKHENSEACLREAIGIAKEEEYTYLVVETLVSMARLAERQGDKKFWREYAKEALTLAAECNYKSLLTQAHLILSRLEHNEDNPKEVERHVDVARKLARLTESYWDKRELEELEIKLRTEQ